MRSRAAVAVASVALALACGKSKEAQSYDQLQQDCGGLVAAGATLQDAVNLFRYSTYYSAPDPSFACRTDLISTGGNDQCPYPTVCHFNWSWYPADPGICNANGCWLGCEVRTATADYQANGTGAKVCAARWFSHNPIPPF